MTVEAIINSRSSSRCDNEASQSRSDSLQSNNTNERNKPNIMKAKGDQPSTSQQQGVKVYYHIDTEIIPYCAILDVVPEKVTLKDFKRVFNRLNFKYFCKVPSPDSEISKEVKVEIRKDDEPLLRSARGQFELYLESYEENCFSDVTPDFTLEPTETSEIFNNVSYSRETCQRSDQRFHQTVTSTETDSYASSSCHPFPSFRRDHSRQRSRFNRDTFRASCRGFGYRDSAIGSDTELQLNSDDDEGVSTSTDITSISRQKPNVSRKRCSRKRFRKCSQSSFYTSIPEHSMSMDVVTVTLNLDIVNYLGISIVGQSSLKGDNGIYVANVIKGGAVALDGRIEPGDMIIQVNDIALDNFTNDQAVDVLKGLVSRRGLIKLTVAKLWDGRPRSNVSVQHNEEPVRPIDLNAWVQHTNAMRGLTSVAGSCTSSNGVLSSSCISPFNSELFDCGQNERIRLSPKLGKMNIVRIMALPNSGLEFKDHFWLKMLIPNSFLGTDLVDWLLEHVEGLRVRREAREFARNLLTEKLIIHFVDMIHFTEKCYYTFGELKDDDSRSFDAENENIMEVPNISKIVLATGSLKIDQSQTPYQLQKLRRPYAINCVANKFL